MNKLIVSPAPHTHSGDSVRRNMLLVIAALMPAYAVSIVAFGWGVLITTAISIVACVACEWLVAKYVLKQEPTIGDLSAVLTGLLLAFNLPSNLPWWIVILGAVVAIGVGKMSFGGLGQNFANPAITARIVLMVSFTSEMTRWIKPLDYDYDAVSSATPLVLAKSGEDLPSYLDLFLGKTGGCLGEVCALGLLIGGLYLAVRKIISLASPVSFIGSLFILSWIGGEDPVYQILAGGVFLGAFFMATDYATTPITTKGKIVFGLGCGIITFVIRSFGSYPEGVSFSILLMNVLTPYIEQLTRTKVLGAKEAEKNEG